MKHMQACGRLVKLVKRSTEYEVDPPSPTASRVELFEMGDKTERSPRLHLVVTSTSRRSPVPPRWLLTSI